MTNYNLFDGTPSIAADADDASVNLGTEFYVTATGWVTQIRFLQPSSGTVSTAARQCAIYSTTNGTTGTLVAGPFTMPAPTSGQWCTYTLVTPFQLVANTRYRVVVRHPAGRYAATSGYFTSGSGSTNRTAGITVRPNRANALDTKQGSYQYSASMAFPFNEFNGGAYYSDVTITDVNPSGVTGTLSAVSPKATADLNGTVRITGTLAATAPRVTGDINGTVRVTGSLPASTPDTTADIAGAVRVAGTLSATTPDTTADIAGTVTITGTMTANVPVLSASFGGSTAVADADRNTPWTLAVTIPWTTLTIAAPSYTLTLDAPDPHTLEVDAPALTLEITTPGLTLEMDA